MSRGFWPSTLTTLLFFEGVNRLWDVLQPRFRYGLTARIREAVGPLFDFLQRALDVLQATLGYFVHGFIRLAVGRKRALFRPVPGPIHVFIPQTRRTNPRRCRP